MNTQHIHNIDDAVELAAQIVYEYPNWSSEHCYEMIQSYAASGEHPPCDYDDLHSLCNRIENHKKKGKNYHKAIELVKKEIQE